MQSSNHREALIQASVNALLTAVCIVAVCFAAFHSAAPEPFRTLLMPAVLVLDPAARILAMLKVDIRGTAELWLIFFSIFLVYTIMWYPVLRLYYAAINKYMR